MNSLFARLFKYTSRDGHAPMENFLSECLCCFLERLTVVDRKSLERFIAEALCGTKAPNALHSNISGARSLSWGTQQPIRCNGQRGYLDICLTADREIILIIENKIAAGFTVHQISPSAEVNDVNDATSCDQLTFYENYLRGRGIAGTCLVLLTHMTAAPSTFVVSQDGKDGAIFRNACHWSEVHRWLTQWKSALEPGFAKDPEYAFLAVMAQELSQFLEDQEMDIPDVNVDDLKVMETFYAQDIPRKMRNLLISVRRSILALPALVTPSGRSPATFDTTNQILWDWTYCFEQDLKWFICWGIAGAGRYGPVSYNIKFDEPLQAFVVIATDGCDIPLPKAKIECLDASGWRAHELSATQKLRLVKSVSPSALFELDGNFNRAFEGWTIRTVEEALKILHEAHTNLPVG